MPQGSILGLLLLFIYVNDMPMAVKCNLFLDADDTCLIFQSDNVKAIDKTAKSRFCHPFNTYAKFSEKLTFLTP